MLSRLVLFLAAIQGTLILSVSCKKERFPVDKCFSEDSPAIPRYHIYHNKCKPLVIGHRGHPKLFQENTMDGLRSALESGADGFEVDVFLTKDNQIVCFHDQNTKRLTGVDRNIEDMTAAEISALRYKKDILYGSQTMHYDQRRPIAFLSEVLQWAKGKHLLVYIEMKPSPKLTPLERMVQIPKSIALGALVATFVANYEMEDQVVVNSFDSVKSLYAKYNNDRLVTGTSWVPTYWNLPQAMYEGQKQEVKALMPGLDTCLDDIPTTGNTFVDFFYRTGTLEKSIQASFVDVQFMMFNNPLFGGSTKTVQMFKKNYGKKIVIGAFTLFDLSKTNTEINAEKKKYKELVKQKVHLLHTDDIIGMKRLIKETPGRHRGCKKHPYY